jgi:hypothetical protein
MWANRDPRDWSEAERNLRREWGDEKYEFRVGLIVRLIQLVVAVILSLILKLIW